MIIPSFLIFYDAWIFKNEMLTWNENGEYWVELELAKKDPKEVKEEK